MQVFAVRTVTVRSSAGTLVFHKRAGQHFAEQPETAEESAAQLKIWIAGHNHHSKTKARKAELSLSATYNSFRDGFWLRRF
jgi:hypothetical protein